MRFTSRIVLAVKSKNRRVRIENQFESLDGVHSKQLAMINIEVSAC